MEIQNNTSLKFIKSKDFCSQPAIVHVFCCWEFEELPQFLRTFYPLRMTTLWSLPPCPAHAALVFPLSRVHNNPLFSTRWKGTKATIEKYDWLSE